jgi:hypothetical protein
MHRLFFSKAIIQKESTVRKQSNQRNQGGESREIQWVTVECKKSPDDAYRAGLLYFKRHR